MLGLSCFENVLEQRQDVLGVPDTKQAMLHERHRILILEVAHFEACVKGALEGYHVVTELFVKVSDELNL
jgi:hypothetical protein